MKTRLALALILLMGPVSGVVVSAPRIPLQLSVTDLDVNAPFNVSDPINNPVNLTNSGGPKVTVSSTSSASWLTVNPNQPDMKGNETVALTVTVKVTDPTVLAVGDYTGT